MPHSFWKFCINGGAEAGPGLVEGDFEYGNFSKDLQRRRVIFGGTKHAIASRSPAFQPLWIAGWGRDEPFLPLDGVSQAHARVHKFRLLPRRIEKASRGMWHPAPGYAAFACEAKVDVSTYPKGPHVLVTSRS